jgi:hypothetical protein
MRGKDYNVGLRGVLFEAAHFERMGSALWLYGWLILRQTRQQGGLGWVLGGAPVSYREIEKETGFNCRTLERWMHRLRSRGYIETEAVPAGVIVRITKAKKFPQGARNHAEAAREFAGGATRNRGANASQLPVGVRVAAPIGSESLEGLKADRGLDDFRRNFHTCRKNSKLNLSCLDQPTQNSDERSQKDAHLEAQRRFLSEARLRFQLLRAEREEAIRRELAVGTGPEVPRP